MKKPFRAFMIFSILTIISTSSVVSAEGTCPAECKCLHTSVLKLKYPMQELWIEHAWWTRSFIVSDLAGLKDKNKVLERLLKNQEDLGNIIKPYYGNEAGNKLTALLKEHTVIAGKMVDAAKTKDQKSAVMLDVQWHKNADDIVAFLTSVNPNWSKKKLKEMFYVHLQLTTDEVVDRLNKNWVEEIKTADINEEHLIQMGDFLTDGIVKQFPEKFK